jgi:hypothetical protein
MSWLSRLLRRNRVEARLDAELRDHLERQVADYVTAGMSERDARRRAAVEFGGLEQVKELCRDARGTRWIENLLQDLRYGIRLSAANPSFTLAAVLSLALGVGANTAIFTLLDATILRPLPVEDPGRLIELLTDRGGPHPGNAFSYQSLVHYRRHATTMDVIASHESTFFVAHGAGQPEIGTGLYVTGDYFHVLGVAAARGRPIQPADDRADAPLVVVLSEAYWRSRFGADPSIVERTISIGGQPAQIVGVAPGAFRGLVPTQAVDFWLPLSAEPLIRTPSLRRLRAISGCSSSREYEPGRRWRLPGQKRWRCFRRPSSSRRSPAAANRCGSACSAGGRPWGRREAACRGSGRNTASCSASFSRSAAWCCSSRA